MTSATPLGEVDRELLQCLICRDLLKEPEVLPCLHRFCGDCLKDRVTRHSRKILCPACHEKHDLTGDGVIRGIRTDSDSKDLVQSVQLQNLTKRGPSQVCICCTKKCWYFFCQGCQDSCKIKNMNVKDYGFHITPGKADARNCSAEKWAPSKEDSQDDMSDQNSDDHGLDMVPRSKTSLETCLEDLATLKETCRDAHSRSRKEAKNNDLQNVPPSQTESRKHISVSRIDLAGIEQSIVDIEGVRAGGWNIDSITAINDGSIVITGTRGRESSHITVINTEGEQLKRNEYDSNNCFNRYCNVLSEYTIATACYRGQVGVYDVKEDKYVWTDVCPITDKFCSAWYVSCVTTDPIKGHIIVGCEVRIHLFVFDSQLEHVSTLKLPEKHYGPTDMATHVGNLIVCADIRAYAVTVKGSACELMYLLPEPRVKNGICRPQAVCTDSCGYIYILWKVNGHKHIIIQYDQDGKHLLKRCLDQNHHPICMTIAASTVPGETVLLATQEGQLITYYTNIRNTGQVPLRSSVNLSQV